ncbi:hypothetical protein F5Y16DRAFT_380720 [Xylariaceae sp. FL0255]|nr:hypothetical protein F5Y16DRAFT_380720 [Xylariaceae sp. FL0255]
MPPNASGSGKKFQYCENSPSWNPDAYLADTELQAHVDALLASSNDLRGAITTSFSLRKTDTYVYHAMVAVTLPQVQQIVGLGSTHGLHDWYFGEEDLNSVSSGDKQKEEENIEEGEGDSKQPEQQQVPKALSPPPHQDVEAYLSIFSPSNSAPTALRNFASNAKKASLRNEIGAHLIAKRYIHPSYHSTLNKLPRAKSRPAPSNPYLKFLSWASRNLEWAGPSAASARGRPTSHPVLPILMHHFGCACPSHECLEILRLLANGREVIDVGSGNGYWTRMLRDYHAFHASKGKDLPTVTPVDSAQSAWRATWIPDTLISDGATYLRKTRSGAADAVLLLVYPIVGGGIAGGSEGGFTRGMLAAYDGDTVAVVGTQNHNGYTGFRNMTMDEFMEREHDDKWVKVVQVPLPSFPGKDEALYVYQRGPRAPTKVASNPVGA